MFSLEFSQFDLEKAELRFTAAKTGKPAVFPLHPSVVRHLRRIWHPQGDRRRHVFSGYSGDGCSRLYSELKGIHHASGSKTYFNLHDLRRTGASEIERVRPGMARVFLQHIPTSVTDVSYLNQSEELKEAILEMRVPTGFSIGVSMQNRQERKAIEAKQKIRPDEYLSPIKPDPDLFKFEPGCWRFMRSDWFRMTGARYRILKRLALSSGPVTVDELAAVVWKGSAKPENWRQSISSRVSEVRQRVKSCLGLSDTCDPIPCVCRLSETAWTIFFPNELFKLYQAKS